jgi:O-antigen ligase
MRNICLVTLALVLGYLVVNQGGVQPESLFPALLVLAPMSGLFALVRRCQPVTPLPPGLAGALLALVLTAGLQLVPLPVWLVKQLSPARFLLAPAGESFAMTLSVAPGQTQEWLITLLACALVFLVARQLMVEFRQREWAVAYPLTAIAALLAVLGIAQYYLGAEEIGASGTYANRNHFAGLLELCLPFPVCLAISHWRKQPDKYHTALGPALKACGFVSIAAIILLGIVLSLSRMGFVATLASLYLIGLVALLSGSGASRWRRLMPVAALGLVILAAFVFLPPDQLIARFADMLNNTDREASRSKIWSDAIPLIRDFPIMGCGLGAFESCFHRYNVAAPNFRVDFAHNDYLQLLAELGLVGFLPLAVLASAAFVASIRRAILRASEESGLIALACAGSLTAIAIHSLADFNLYIPANAIAVSWIGGMALRPRHS